LDVDIDSYETASRYLRKALQLAPPPFTEAWEPTVVNLAHSLRKLKYVIFVVRDFRRFYCTIIAFAAPSVGLLMQQLGFMQVVP